MVVEFFFMYLVTRLNTNNRSIMEKKFDNLTLLPEINEKCDIIIKLLSSLCDDPDFLIGTLRKCMERQCKISSSRMKIVRGHGSGTGCD